MPQQPLFSGGIFVPVETGRSGGFRLLSGDEYVTQLIVGLSGDRSSDNPFLTQGLGQRAVFQNLTDPAWQAQEIRNVKNIFRQLEQAQIAKLRSVEVEPGSPDSGLGRIKIRYLSIETATEQMLETTVRRSA